MSSPTTASLACVIFADTMERRFRAMADSAERDLVPNPGAVMRWRLAAERTAGEGRTADVREFGDRLMTVFRERASACPCRCVNGDRQDHFRSCARYVWSRADWMVQQELADLELD